MANMSGSLRLVRRYSQKAGAAAHGDHEAAAKLWRNLSLFVAAPTVFIGTVSTIMKEMKHGHHHEPYVPYPYLNIMNKAFPWRDGQKNLFYNPRFNSRQ